MRTRLLLLLPLAVAAIAAASRADEASVPDNAVEALEARMAKGESKLAYAPDGHGYLASVLAALKVSPQSQVLPFTKSSLQFDRISPATPRAVYFNDDLAVGSVHPGGLIEIIANDRRGGIAFYTLDNNAPGKPPHFQTESARCAVCHGMVNTVTPGWIVANITATADGMPQIINPAHPFDFTDQTRPFEDRWGGWYVTGASQNMHHLGNVTVPDPDKPFEMPADGGRTLASLSGRFDPAHTLQPSSDIVALMTLEHQTGFINRLYALNIQYSDAALDDLVAYMTFADEVPLPGPIRGDSGFAADFASRGPRDDKGRSLRAFDLKTRLFRYPLSYMVYSSAFDTLKPDIREKLYRRLYDALKAKGADGADAIAILAATKPGLPDYWK
ncbi:MAG TPA: hypothetical protein VHC39_06605 [Rhizomicrobium sp.]|nr:hypothetical protein [Rhizomicrobium sp.]